MIIHGFEKSSRSIFAVIQTASPGGAKYDAPVNLRLVRIAPELFAEDRLDKTFPQRIEGKELPQTDGIQILKEIRADAKDQGSNSHFEQTLGALKAELPSYAANDDLELLQATVPTVSPAIARPKPSRGGRL